MDILQAIFPCFGFSEESASVKYSIDEPPNAQEAEMTATRVMDILLNSEKSGLEMQQKIQDVVAQSGGWTQWLAHKVLEGIQKALENVQALSPVMKKAYDRACEEVEKLENLAKEHPYYTAAICSLIALGVCVLLTPWVIEALGFAELGPVEGSFAAWWQSFYGGCVPAGSLFSFFQRLGMILKLSRSVMTAQLLAGHANIGRPMKL